MRSTQGLGVNSIMRSNTSAATATVEQLVSEAIASQRQLRASLPPVRKALPLSVRFAVDSICKTPPEDMFQAHMLDNAEDVASRLKVLLKEMGGAPALHHTEGGDPDWVGGSEVGRRTEALIECLGKMLGHAWKASDRISARAVLGRCN